MRALLFHQLEHPAQQTEYMLGVNYLPSCSSILHELKFRRPPQPVIGSERIFFLKISIMQFCNWRQASNRQFAWSGHEKDLDCLGRWKRILSQRAIVSFHFSRRTNDWERRWKLQKILHDFRWRKSCLRNLFLILRWSLRCILQFFAFQ